MVRSSDLRALCSSSECLDHNIKDGLRSKWCESPSWEEVGKTGGLVFLDAVDGRRPNLGHEVLPAGRNPLSATRQDCYSIVGRLVAIRTRVRSFRGIRQPGPDRRGPSSAVSLNTWLGPDHATLDALSRSHGTSRFCQQV
jgi:hypothetical protein